MQTSQEKKTMPSANRFRAILAFGILQLITGLTMLGAGLVLVIRKSWTMESFHGIWGGLLLSCTGIMGISDGARNHGCRLYILLCLLNALGVWHFLCIISYWGWEVDSRMTRSNQQTTCASPPQNRTDSGLYETEILLEGYQPCGNQPAVVANMVVIVCAAISCPLGLGAGMMGCFTVCGVCGGNRDHEEDELEIQNAQEAQNSAALVSSNHI